MGNLLDPWTESAQGTFFTTQKLGNDVIRPQLCKLKQLLVDVSKCFKILPHPNPPNCSNPQRRPAAHLQFRRTQVSKVA